MAGILISAEGRLGFITSSLRIAGVLIVEGYVEFVVNEGWIAVKTCRKDYFLNLTSQRTTCLLGL